jgi:hypothetical protein
MVLDRLRGWKTGELKVESFTKVIDELDKQRRLSRDEKTDYLALRVNLKLLGNTIKYRYKNLKEIDVNSVFLEVLKKYFSGKKRMDLARRDKYVKELKEAIEKASGGEIQLLSVE